MWAVAAQPRTGLTPMIPTPSVDSGLARADVTSNLLLRAGIRGAGGEAPHVLQESTVNRIGIIPGQLPPQPQRRAGRPLGAGGCLAPPRHLLRSPRPARLPPPSPGRPPAALARPVPERAHQAVGGEDRLV